MAKLKVKFDDPEHRWITVSVSDGVDGRLMSVSTYWPSFTELTTALIGLTDDRAAYRVTWVDGPNQTCWNFEKREGTVSFESRDSNLPDAVFRFAGSYEQVCLPFWRALRELEGRFSRAELAQRMGDKFPHAELARLTERVEAMKAHEPK